LNLETICDGLADTEVDEVVATGVLIAKSLREIMRQSSRADEGICFTRPVGSTVDLLNDRGVQS
jgi:hypothetical protein